MQIELLHRNDLRVAASRCAALDAECRALRGLSDASERDFAEVSAEGLRQTDGGRRFAFAERSWRNAAVNQFGSVR